jgi:hypothetical protein
MSRSGKREIERGGGEVNRTVRRSKCALIDGRGAVSHPAGKERGKELFLSSEGTQGRQVSGDNSSLFSSLPSSHQMTSMVVSKLLQVPGAECEGCCCSLTTEAWLGVMAEGGRGSWAEAQVNQQ